MNLETSKTVYFTVSSSDLKQFDKTINKLSEHQFYPLFGHSATWTEHKGFIYTLLMSKIVNTEEEDDEIKRLTADLR